MFLHPSFSIPPHSSLQLHSNAEIAYSPAATCTTTKGYRADRVSALIYTRGSACVPLVVRYCPLLCEMFFILQRSFGAEMRQLGLITLTHIPV
ncbi:hypothetical protein GHT06_018236 [Daphnia sinensis]|uniref:Uncharacterized protein n=1 Tax=Daphnia sinensis TaxID=1820382 RepID=A0AAD5PPZ8_9CRUS|nr:hypothetical protein GHT06_018236 [Daphnia sinensis]